MPLYYNNGTASRWYTPTSATTVTNNYWINWATNGTAATTITTAVTTPITPTIYWYTADDWSNDNTYTPVRTMIPQRRPIAPERFHIARRSPAQAAGR